MPIGNRIPYNILHVVSSFFTQPFCFWRDHSGNKAALSVFVIPAIAPYIEYINTISMINVLQIVELIFCDSDKKLLNCLLGKIVLILYFEISL